MPKVRVRYAPSPTGIPHVGNIRTALFDYLIAKKNKGAFILRVEDTDQKRRVPESLEKIKESLMALKLNWDEYYEQSTRIEIYKKYLEQLINKGTAYEDEGAWRFKIEKGNSVGWEDLVYGKIEFKTDVLEDFIIIKSDGFPTYHFASVVDDHEMAISHVVRGEEWISSTPKHLLLYKALGWEPPKFVHLPTILGPNKKKLSKREGAKPVFEYLEEGFLPEAIVNFLALLGWAPKGDKEIFSQEELVEEFSIDRINKNSPVFNIEKLKWFNGQWIKKLEDHTLAKRINQIFPDYLLNEIEKIAPLIKQRIFTLIEFEEVAGFFFRKPPLTQIPKVPISTSTVSETAVAFNKLATWDAQSIKNFFESFSKSKNIDRIELITSVRNIISGKEVTPPLYESLEILGKDETIDRLKCYEKGRS